MANHTFNDVPVLRHSRSRQDLSHGVKTTANVGTLYPFEVQEVYAGDTFKVRTTTVSRLTSQFIRPVMDNLFLDIYYFFVPSRLLYDNWPNIFGENTQSQWANSQEYVAPMIPAGTAVPSKSVGDYLGLPTGQALTVPVSVLPFRAFAKIYDDWFRDQNNVLPMHIQTGEYNESENFNDSAWAPGNYTGQLPSVAKFHDYFTSALPAPQKGSASSIPITGGSMPVTFSGGPVPVAPVNGYGILNREGNAHVNSLPGFSSSGMTWIHSDRGNLGATISTDSMTLTGHRLASAQEMTSYGTQTMDTNVTSNSSNMVIPGNLGAFLDFGLMGGPGSTGYSPLSATASLTGVDPISVNDLRFAFQFQKMLERDARSGTRYVEYLASHFGVIAGDYRLQRSEFLGGRRSPLSIHQVVQSTGSGSDSSPLGEVGAYSLSNSKSRFTKSFTENGYVIGVFCIRQHHTYQQGVEKFWTRSKRTDFYDPVFAHIGEQPVYQTELYAGAEAGTVFGYQEAWADLRYRPNRVSGQMRSDASDSLDVWHFADDYESAPTLNSQFIQETPTYVDRAITVPSSTQDQFILDFWVQNIAYRVMPTYSVPSLIDHD